MFDFSLVFGVRKLESLDNRMALFALSYIYVFWYIVGLWQTDGQTETWRQHTLR